MDYKNTSRIDPRQLTKARSFFYNEEEEGEKFYATMTIVFALKRDFRTPNGKEYPEPKTPFQELEFDMSLTDRIRYLLIKFGFTKDDIPNFKKLPDDIDYEPDIDYRLDLDDLREDYYFVCAENWPIYEIWKFCDWLYSNRARTGGYITIEKIIDERINMAGDNLIFLYALYGEVT